MVCRALCGWLPLLMTGVLVWLVPAAAYADDADASLSDAEAAAAEYDNNDRGDEDKTESGASVVPIPFVASNPNRGLHAGLLLPIFAFWPDETVDMFVPSVSYGGAVDTVLGMRYFHFGARESRAEFRYLHSTNSELIDLFADVVFPRLEPGIGLDFTVNWRKDPFPRFFGIGPDATDETSYTARGITLEATLWTYLHEHVRLGLHEVFELFEVERSPLELPQTLDVFPEVPGVTETPRIFWHGVRLELDTRDERSMPREGILLEATVALALRALGASFDANRFAFRLRGVAELLEERMLILAGKISFEHVAGPRASTPFQALSQLGGHDSWRGGPVGRFTDRRLFFTALELRWAAFAVRLFGYDVEAELAPFFELGQVFDGVDDLALNRLQPAVGLGLRALVRPRIIGVVDIAFSRDGLAVYTTLSYPF